MHFPLLSLAVWRHCFHGTKSAETQAKVATEKVKVPPLPTPSSSWAVFTNLDRTQQQHCSRPLLAELVEWARALAQQVTYSRPLKCSLAIQLMQCLLFPSLTKKRQHSFSQWKGPSGLECPTAQTTVQLELLWWSPSWQCTTYCFPRRMCISTRALSSFVNSTFALSYAESI